VTSVENEDMEAYAENVEHSEDMVNFGAFGDPIVGWDALQKVMEGQNAGLEDIKITVTDMKIHLVPSGLVAWATCLWDFEAKMGGQEMSLPVRCTWVLEKEGEDWKIIHFHKSVPAG
jgi:ketosteroid isomerase-like protein